MEKIIVRATGKNGMRTFYVNKVKDDTLVFKEEGLNLFAKEFIKTYPELIEGIIMYSKSGAITDLSECIIITRMDSSIQRAFVEAIERNFNSMKQECEAV